MRSRTDCVLLGLLAQAPLSGYEVRRTLADAVSHIWSESFGQVYPALRRLEREGLIVAHGTTGARGRQRYATTGEGRRVLDAWFEAPVVAAPPRQELLLKLFFGPLAPPGVLRAQVEAMRARTAEHLARLDAIAADFDAAEAPPPDLAYWRLTLTQGQYVLRALLAWADDTLATLPPSLPR